MPQEVLNKCHQDESRGLTMRRKGLTLPLLCLPTRMNPFAILFSSEMMLFSRKEIHEVMPKESVNDHEIHHKWCGKVKKITTCRNRARGALENLAFFWSQNVVGKFYLNGSAFSTCRKKWRKNRIFFQQPRLSETHSYGGDYTFITHTRLTDTHL